MIRIEAPGRLHFGLLALPGDAAWPDADGQLTMPPRVFGGVGLMIDKPGIALTAQPANKWSVEGPCANRALTIARSLTTQPFAIRTERCPLEHVGLGTGTQLSLAVARAISLAIGEDAVAASELARRTQRGRRSAIGIHGFAQGGFLVEAGKSNVEGISPLAARLDFPDEWAVLLVIPRGLQGDHGPRETRAFEQLQPDLSRTESLCRLVLLGMIPAILERNLDAFGESLYEFNRRAGELFCTWQGGVYAHHCVAELVRRIRQLGVKGVGQSSWGPAVFAVASTEHVEDLRNRLASQFGDDHHEIHIARGNNRGALVCPTWITQSTGS